MRRVLPRTAVFFYCDHCGDEFGVDGFRPGEVCPECRGGRLRLHAPPRVCACRCHAGITGAVRVDVHDVIEAAVACNSCRPVHSPALLTRERRTQSGGWLGEDGG